MENHASKRRVDKDMAADILLNIARLMEWLHERDVALQDALSKLALERLPSSKMNELQHIDLLTQTHLDLSQLLAVLSSCVRGAPTELEDLRMAMTLHSLCGKLIDNGANATVDEAGEISLF